MIFALIACVGDPTARRSGARPVPGAGDAARGHASGPMPYPEMYPPEDPRLPPDGRRADAVHRPRRSTRSRARSSSTGSTASDATMRVAQLRVLGGAMARVPADATAFAHRGEPDHGQRRGVLRGPEDRPVREAWVDRCRLDLEQDDHGAYVNFLGDEGEERVRAAYPGATWDRLAAIKARYDPTNLFQRNQNMPPAAAGRTAMPRRRLLTSADGARPVRRARRRRRARPRPASRAPRRSSPKPGRGPSPG